MKENHDCPDCSYEDYAGYFWRYLEAVEQGADVYLTTCEKFLKNRDEIQSIFSNYGSRKVPKIMKPSECLSSLTQ